MKRKIEAPYTPEQLSLMHIANQPYMNKLWLKGQENERYISADHFTDQEKSDYASQDRFPFSVALTEQKINTIVASEKENRTSFKVESKTDPADEPKAELAGLRLKNIEMSSGLKYIESDSFLSGVGVIYGVIALRVRQDDAGNNEIYFEEVDYKDFIWDGNAKKYEKDDALFMAEKKRVYRFQLEMDYPDIPLQNPTSDGWWTSRASLDYFYSASIDKPENDIITKFTHYHKVVRDYWCVFFKGEKVAEFRDKKEALDLLKILKMPYLAEAMPEPPGFVERVPKVRMDKYVFTYTDILEYEETDLDFHPYSIYQAFQFKDKIWSMTDILKSNQIFLDKLIAQIDYALGQDIKSGFEVVVPKLASGITAEEAVRRAKNGEGVPVLVAGSIKWIDRNSIDPSWLSVYEVMMNLGNDIGGGRSFAGLQDSSGESGIAIRQKMMQGEKIASLFIDNKFRMKRDLGRKALRFMGLYDTAPSMIKIIGAALSPQMLQLLSMQNLYTPSQNEEGMGYVQINQMDKPISQMAWLKDADFELTVTEEALSESQRQMKYAMYLDAEKSDPSLIMSPTWRRLKLEVMDVPFTDRQKLLTELQQIQMMQQQQAQADAQKEERNRLDENAKFVLSETNKRKDSEKKEKTKK